MKPRPAQPEEREPFIVRVERRGKEIARVTQGAAGAPSFAGEPLSPLEAYRLAAILCGLYVLAPGEAG